MILRTELRRSTAPVVGIGLLLVSLALIYGLSGPWGKRTAPWDEQWTGLAQWTRYLSLFLWPLVLGAGAWQGLRDKRSRVPELFATTPKAPWRRVLPTAGRAGDHAHRRVRRAARRRRGAGGGDRDLLPPEVAAGGRGDGAGAGRRSRCWASASAGWCRRWSRRRCWPSPRSRRRPRVLQEGWPLLLTPAFEAPDITVFTTVAVPVTLTQALWFPGIGGDRLRTVRRVPCLDKGGRAAAGGAGRRGGRTRTVRCGQSGGGGPGRAGTGVRRRRAEGLRDPRTRRLPADAHRDRRGKRWHCWRKLPSPPTSVVEMPPDDDARAPAGAAPVFLPCRLPTDPAKIRVGRARRRRARRCAGRPTGGR